MLIKYTSDSKSETLRMRYPFQSFTPKWEVVSRSHDTFARFRTGVKFSPRYAGVTRTGMTFCGGIM